MIQHRRIAALLIGALYVAPLLAVALAAPAGASGISVKVTPSRNLHKGEKLTVTGTGLPYATNGAPNMFFMAECTPAVVAKLNTSDTGHCNIGAVESLKVTKSGSFKATIKVVTGTVGEGECGVPKHLDCVIGVGDLTEQGTVVKITFKS
jgi:hypothetical protein